MKYCLLVKRENNRIGDSVMQLLFKIILVVFLSITMSIIGFMISALYICALLGGGYTPLEICLLAEEIAKELQQTGRNQLSEGKDISYQEERVLKRWKEQYSELNIDYISDTGKVLFSSSGRKEKYPLLQVLEDIQNNQNQIGEKIFLARVDLNGENHALILIHVPEIQMTPIQVILYNRGSSNILIMLITALITLIVFLGLFAYLFILNIN